MGSGQSEKSRRDRVLEGDDYVCQYCERDFEDLPHQLNTVPIKPVSEGGRGPDNFEARCDRCASLPGHSRDEKSDEIEDPFVLRLEALDRAQTLQSFGDDGLQIIKIGLSIPVGLSAIFGLGIKSKQLESISVLTNEFFLAGFFLWGVSLLFSGIAYYYSRVSGASPPVVEQLFETDEDNLPDEELDVTSATKNSYRRNACLIGIAIVSLAIAVSLFIVSYLDILGILLSSGNG